VEEEQQVVEFEDGSTATVKRIESNIILQEVNTVSPVDEFYNTLAERTEVERMSDRRAYFGHGGFDIKSMANDGLFDLAYEAGVEVQQLWPVFMEDDTGLPMFIMVEEV
jgi:hypothetical protein